MRILVDAMGGDNAPAAAALGAIRAAEALGTEVVLVGRGEEILKALADHQIQTLPKGVEIANADDVVDMHDDPATVLKKKPQSSMVVGLQMLRDGGGDVVVADGFSGNVLLKTIEGTAKFMSGMMKDMFKRNFLTKLAALACRSGIQDFKKKMDYRETGGTLLLGLRKPVVKAHGSSDELAFYHAVRQAVNAVEANITQDIQDNIEKMAVPKELEHADET